MAPKSLEALPTTVEEARTRIRALIEPAAPETAARETDWILEWVTGLDRARLLVAGNSPLDSDQANRAMGAAMRRATREPLQYILGRADFFGRTFEVGPGALIPRPETEHLVEEALQGLPGNARVLDAGAGSGCIACTISLERPDVSVFALDISPVALDWSRRNTQKLDARVTHIQGDMLNPEQVLPRGLDLIASNPPYVPREDAPDLQPELAHEPETALFVDGDREAYVRALVRWAGRLLVPGGRLLVETHAPDAARLLELLRSTHLGAQRIVRDLSGRPRVLCATRQPF
ncbi:MAG: peptide chain release factor N(5)-glutamine methyltransferase [Rhodothermales bacterium]|nr:peptide chain release factor N(5)-glutamine methyltransferase [Rhodothermales bacterium]MBO6778478.1 peptide chain release factor N(5)-glutamine methyltransferase [Rhodothermales bacterium]